jgi:hypothetical protein
LQPTIATIAILFVAACYPRPYEYTRSPEVTGVLLRAGAPVSGMRVMFAHTRGDDGNYCRDGAVVAITDEEGKFHVGPSTRLHFFTSLLNPPKYVSALTSVCFDPGEGRTLGVLLLAPTDRKTSYALSCDLSAPPREFKQSVIWPKGKWGICRNSG